MHTGFSAFLHPLVCSCFVPLSASTKKTSAPRLRREYVQGYRISLLLGRLLTALSAAAASCENTKIQSLVPPPVRAAHPRIWTIHPVDLLVAPENDPCLNPLYVKGGTLQFGSFYRKRRKHRPVGGRGHPPIRRDTLVYATTDFGRRKTVALNFLSRPC